MIAPDPIGNIKAFTSQCYRRHGSVPAYAPGWDKGPIPQRSSGGVEPGEVRNDTRDLMARWAPPASYFNLTPEELSSPFFE